jgi:hypothetical protein
MRPRLLDRQGLPTQALQVDEASLHDDLSLGVLLDAMARGESRLYESGKRVLLAGLDQPQAIRYRQDVLRDCLGSPAIVRDMYDISITVLSETRLRWRGETPASRVTSSVDEVRVYVAALKRLREIADEHGPKFTSDGFREFFALLQRELPDAYFAEVDEHLSTLRFPEGVLLSAKLGDGNRGVDYALRRRTRAGQPRAGQPRAGQPRARHLWQRDRSHPSFELHPRDVHGARTLRELKSRGLACVADVMTCSATHLRRFFDSMTDELAFYLGCVNLHEELREKGGDTSFPVPADTTSEVLAARGLYDPCLRLTSSGRIIGNDLQADGKSLVVITGANQGGKSTFLRSVGLAHLMMHAGMFVSAREYRSSTRGSLFTHYRREEDPEMKRGKLDEELARMRRIVDAASSRSVVLLNESFSATNERDGSEIARQVVRGLQARGVRVFFVTHLFDFGKSIHSQGWRGDLFLRAERGRDGRRSFQIVDAPPISTSHGADVYREVFEKGRDPVEPAR